MSELLRSQLALLASESISPALWKAWEGRTVFLVMAQAPQAHSHPSSFHGLPEFFSGHMAIHPPVHFHNGCLHHVTEEVESPGGALYIVPCVPRWGKLRLRETMTPSWGHTAEIPPSLWPLRKCTQEGLRGEKKHLPLFQYAQSTLMGVLNSSQKKKNWGRRWL